jgi:hypothetical protein
MTTAELEDAVLTYYLNQGSAVVVQDADQRRKAWFLATKAAKRLWDSAPYWFKKGDGQVVLTSGVGAMPNDFSTIGTQGQVYITGQRFRPLEYKAPDWIKYQIANTPQLGQPWAYSLYGQTSLGVPKILCWPTDNSTLDVLAYDKKTPELIDRPYPAPTLALNGVGLLTGAYYYGVTFVTASGETEGGVTSLPITAATNKILVSGIPTWYGRTVTSRKLYRTAAGGSQLKLVATIADNTTTTYDDNNLDGTLGANIPLPAASVSGLEVFPEQFHESALYDGLVFLMGRAQGDGRDIRFSAEWDRQVQRMWEEIQQGQNKINAFPPFPGFISGHPVWSRWTPPQ